MQLGPTTSSFSKKHTQAPCGHHPEPRSAIGLGIAHQNNISIVSKAPKGLHVSFVTLYIARSPWLPHTITPSSCGSISMREPPYHGIFTLQCNISPTLSTFALHREFYGHYLLDLYDDISHYSTSMRVIIFRDFKVYTEN